MTKNEEGMRKNFESIESILKNPKSQELVPSTGPRTVIMLEAGCSSQEYYQALMEDYRALVGQNFESMENIHKNLKSQELVPSMDPRTVIMLEAGCSSQEYYQALMEDYRALVGQNGK